MSFKVIACLGDSIANGYWDDRGLGWFGRLQEKIAKAYPLQFGFNNMAQSGDRSIDVFHRMCAEAIHREPDILIIAVGINDLIRWHSADGATDQSPQTIHETWHRMLKTAQKNFDKILVVELIPNDESVYPCTGYDGKTPMWNRISDTKGYNTNLKKWCEEFDVEFCPTFDAWIEEGHIDLLHDESHPNGKGHEFLATQVFIKLKELKWLV